LSAFFFLFSTFFCLKTYAFSSLEPKAMVSQLIRTVIVEDEKNSFLLLTKLLEKYCPSVKIIGTAHNVAEAVKVLNAEKPDLVFMDVNMPDGDGFEVLERVQDREFAVIFTTAYDRYAMKAFEFSALHYLLKPIDHKELQEAIKRFENSKPENLLESKLKVMADSLSAQPQKIMVPSSNGLIVVELDDIIRCESTNNYTIFHLKDGKPLMVSKPISSYEEILSDLHFLRIHNKHLINLKYVKRYVKGRGGYVVMQDDSEADISESKKKEFMLKLGEIARGGNVIG